MLHQVPMSIVRECKIENYGIICENLKGIRSSVNKRVKRYNKYSRKVQAISKLPKKLKRRLNNWWFRKFLRQIAYKSAWEGIKLIEVSPKGTSSTCPICGFKLAKYSNGKYCVKGANIKRIGILLPVLISSDGSFWFELDRHALIMVENGLEEIYSYDKHFDKIEFIKRVVPE